MGKCLNKKIKSLDFDVNILGAEGKVLRRLTRESCDDIVKIRIADEMESLNLSNAA